MFLVTERAVAKRRSPSLLHRCRARWSKKGGEEGEELLAAVADVGDDEEEVAVVVVAVVEEEKREREGRRKDGQGDRRCRLRRVRRARFIFFLERGVCMERSFVDVGMVGVE